MSTEATRPVIAAGIQQIGVCKHVYDRGIFSNRQARSESYLLATWCTSCGTAQWNYAPPPPPPDLKPLEESSQTS